jgi:hypothetical protein
VNLVWDKGKTECGTDREPVAAGWDGFSERQDLAAGRAGKVEIVEQTYYRDQLKWIWRVD